MTASRPDSGGKGISSPLHVAVVLDGVPHTRHGGGGVTAYSIISAMIKADVTVSLVVLPQAFDTLGADRDKDIGHFEGMGISVHQLSGQASPGGRKESMWPARLRRIAHIPKTEDMFSGGRHAGTVASFVSELSPNVVFGYHWDALAAMEHIHTVPTMGLVGDPHELPFLMRNQFLALNNPGVLHDRIRRLIAERLYVGSTRKICRRLLRKCDRRGAFAAHHATMFSNHCASECGYYRTPVPDPLLPGKVRQARNGKFRIMHIGHLRGIATLLGIEMLAFEILPQLEQLLPPDSFEIHIVGGYFKTLPAKLRKALEHPAVILRGQVTPADDEFLSSHVLIVPTPVELGIRVRIITAFSFGTAIVTHRANAAGIPELKHQKNCLIGQTGSELAGLCAEIYRDPSLLSRLERGAREAYEQTFSIDVAGRKIVTDLIDLAAGST